MNSLRSKTKKNSTTFTKKNVETSSLQKSLIDPEISGNLTQVERNRLKELHQELNKLK